MPVPTDLALGALAIVAGAVAAVTGFGIGSLLTPALAISVGTRAAVAAVAIPHAVATAVRLWMLRRSIDRRVLRSFGLPSAAGGLAGAILHALFPSPVLAVVLGALLVVAGLLEVTGVGVRVRLSEAWGVVAGIASGLFGGLVGNQGGIRSVALLRFDLGRQTLVATATATALLVDAARLPVYLVADGAEVARLASTVVVLTVGGVVGTVAGAPILRRLPETAFRRVLGAVLILVGLILALGIGR